MNDPVFLIENLKSAFPELSDIAHPLEYLENVRYRNIYDTGIWYDEKNHLTIITTYLCDSDYLNSTFSIAVDGRLLRNTIKGSKYQSDLDIDGVHKIIRKSIDAVVLNSKIADGLMSRK